MEFKKRRINSNLQKIREFITRSDKNPLSNTSGSNTIFPSPVSNLPPSLKYGVILVGILIIIGLFWLTISLIKSLDFGSLVFSFGKQLKTDSHGYTNFILTGTGGAEHDGGNLTDTIMIVSLNSDTKSVKMLSLPRDLYIDDKLTGGQRINKIYDTYYHKYKSSQEGMSKLAETITSITDIPIQYTVKVDFDGFVKIIDALGGITVNVENAIHDPYFPLGESEFYQTFNIEAGVQQLDGETALKYARSRKTTSDFDRAKRQQQIMTAIKEKAFDLDLLTNPSKLQTLYGSLADSITTNLTVSEILELAKIAKDINKDNIQSRVINDDFTSCGGILYTPVRDYFGGAAVLLPAGNEFDEMKRFAQNYFYNDTTSINPIQVLNATKTSGLAYNYLNRFSRECLDVIYYGNATNREQEKSVIYYNRDLNGKIPEALKVVKEMFDAPVVEGIPSEYLDTPKRAPAQIVLEIGMDYQNLTFPDPFNNLKYMTPIEDPNAEKTDETTGAEPIAIRGETTASHSSTSTGTTTSSESTTTSSSSTTGTTSTKLPK